MLMCADTCTNKQRDERFQKALDAIVRPGDRERHGIGMQKEKTLHAVLKAYEDPDERRSPSQRSRPPISVICAASLTLSCRSTM